MDTKTRFWHETTFQNTIEVALQFSKKPAP